LRLWQGRDESKKASGSRRKEKAAQTRLRIEGWLIVGFEPEAHQLKLMKE